MYPYNGKGFSWIQNEMYWFQHAMHDSWQTFFKSCTGTLTLPVTAVQKHTENIGSFTTWNNINRVSQWSALALNYQMLFILL